MGNQATSTCKWNTGRALVFGLGLAGFAIGAQADILITEVMYDPNLGNEHEYVELYNAGTETVDLTDYVIADDPNQDFPNSYTLTSGSIAPGGTAVLIRIDTARTLENFQNAWGTDVNWIEVPVWPVFTNGGDIVELSDPLGTVIASVNYNITNGFPFPNDSSSIYMVDVNAEAPYDPTNWALSTDGVDGAHYGNAPRVNDLGSPGYVPGVETAIDGDLNGDGFVGLDDLDIILSAWNQNVPPIDTSADPSGDGFVGLDDLDIVLNNWNAGTPPTQGAAVPEPASLALLSLGVAAALRRR